MMLTKRDKQRAAAAQHRLAAEYAGEAWAILEAGDSAATEHAARALAILEARGYGGEALTTQPAAEAGMTWLEAARWRLREALRLCGDRRASGYLRAALAAMGKKDEARR